MLVAIRVVLRGQAKRQMNWYQEKKKEKKKKTSRDVRTHPLNLRENTHKRDNLIHLLFVPGIMWALVTLYENFVYHIITLNIPAVNLMS